MQPKVTVIAVDGPGGAGKGELCIRLSRKYGFAILDSGAIYRVLAYAALQKNIPLDKQSGEDFKRKNYQKMVRKLFSQNRCRRRNTKPCKRTCGL